MAKKSGAVVMRQLMNGFITIQGHNNKLHEHVLPRGYLTVSSDNPIRLNENINEGLIKTYPIDTTIRHIKEFFHLDDWQIKKVTLANDVEGIHVIVAEIGNNQKVMTQAMTSCGYHFSRVYSEYFDEHDDINYITLEYLPKFQEDNCTEEVRKEELILYHITPRYNESKIRRIGFSPRTKNTINDYPNRVYLLRGSAGEEVLLYLAAGLYNANNTEGNKNEYTVFVLDTNKVCDKVNLYKDPQSHRGLWTYNNIPPDAIVSVKHIEFDKNGTPVIK